jgi:hypothetical protein
MLYVEVDGTGVPVRPGETEGREGKSEDGKAGTREIKLARLFTQSGFDPRGRPVMDPGSSSYVATFDGTDVFAGLAGAEHLHDLAAHLAFITPDPPQWLAGRLEELDAGNIEAIIGAARQYPLEGVKAEALDRKLGYFEHNIHRMRYAHFRDLGMFTGSGAIEAACKQSSSSAPSSPACTGPPRAPPTSSPCAASTPAAAGTIGA